MVATTQLKLAFEAGDVSAKKVLICAEMCDVNVKQEPNSTSLSPIGKSPVLRTHEGDIWQSEAIGWYLSQLRRDSYLSGGTFYQSAVVSQWVSFCTQELEAPLMCWSEGKALETAKRDVAVCLSVLNAHLLHHTYLAAENITMADIWVAVVLADATQKRKEIADELLRSYPNVSRWLETCKNQKQFQKHLTGSAKAATSAPQKADKKAKEENEDDGEEAPPKKAPNPLDSLPPSSMTLDEWKRTYSNTKDLYGVAMKWFWEHYDSAGWSLWYMKYDKLEDECTVAYLTSNQLGGFLQRVDNNFRKYSFAVMDVVEDATGAKPSFDIQGVWLWRGQEVPEEIKDHVQYEYHKFTKLDAKKPDHKKLVQDYWCANETVEGRKIADSKVWK